MRVLFRGSSGRSGNGGNVITGGGGPGQPNEPNPRPGGMHSNVLGMLFFILSEFMLFGALIIAFLFGRLSRALWPPPGQPRLPIIATGFNSLFLLASGYTMLKAWQAIRSDDSEKCASWLLSTGILGSFFFVFQGYEWAGLIQFGLALQSNFFGALFYVVVGMHALHVFIAVIAIFIVYSRTKKYDYSSHRNAGVSMCAIFWWFVVCVWPFLYIFVYIF